MSRNKKRVVEDDVGDLEDIPIIEEQEPDNEVEEEKPTKKTIKRRNSNSGSESEEEKPVVKTKQKRTLKLITPTKNKKITKEAASTKKQGTYPFDKEFMRSYKTLVEMLKDRGYNLSQPGKESIFGYSERIVPSKNEEGTKVKKMINITDETQRALTNEFGGLENLKIELTHPNVELNILIYFIVPGIEAKSATQARKQLPIDQVRTALKAYESSGIPRLILLSNVELATQGQALIRDANSQKVKDQPHRYIHFFSTEELSFNWMSSRYQPKNIRVLRDHEQNAVLSSIEVDDNQEDKRYSLPYYSDNDPLCLWYGAKSGDLIQLTRKLPITTEYLRYVFPFELLAT